MSRLDRRQLLGRSAAIAAAVWVAPVVTPLGVAPAAAASGVATSGQFIAPAANRGWNNEPISGGGPIDSICLTPTSLTVSGIAFIFGLNTDPNTNAHYNTIDHGIYLFVRNGVVRIYLIRNGGLSYVGIFPLTTELCVNRISATQVQSTVGGAVVRTTNIVSSSVLYADSSAYGNNGAYGGTLAYDYITC